jgi:hypothetical protein
MAHRVSLRYLAAKLAASAEEVAIQMQSSATSGLTEALAKGMEAFRRQLTAVGAVTGISMVPTLNADAVTRPEAAEKFLMRLIPRPVAQRSVFEGDVIAFTSPLVSPGTTADQIMVRRVAALEGEELVTDEPEEDAEAIVIPEGYCWVLADNEELAFPDVIDSRTFGPLPLNNIIGRVMYAAKSQTDHGPVENSISGMESDAAVLEAELDLDTLVGEDSSVEEDSKE